MKRYILTISPVILLVAAIFACNKEDSQSTVDPDDWPVADIRVVKSGFNQPWEILWGKDDYLWITERNGKVSKLDAKTGNILFQKELTEVVSQGEGGLLGMVQHPDFLTNGLIYVVYNYNKGGTYTEKVVRFTYTNNDLTNAFTVIDNIPAASIHNGSRLVITSDLKLMITTGDASNTGLAQNNGSLAGKVLRVNLDGSVPADNPIAGSAIWSFGHRNAQGLVLVNGILYASEHGPEIEDEVNIIESNRNYGWPNVKGPCTGDENAFCTANNVKEPIWSSGGFTVATAGLDYYNKDRIPQWKNSLLLATLKDATLYQLQLAGDGRTVTNVKSYFKAKWGRLRDICVSPAGRVYVCTGNGGNRDQIVEIQKPE